MKICVNEASDNSFIKQNPQKDFKRRHIDLTSLGKARDEGEREPNPVWVGAML